MRYRLKRDIENRDKAWKDLEKALRTSWEMLPKNENSTTVSANDDPPQIQAADTVVLYAGDQGYDESRFERLVPQTIKLI